MFVNFIYFSFSVVYIFFTVHPRKDNVYRSYWAEIMRQHTSQHDHLTYKAETNALISSLGIKIIYKYKNKNMARYSINAISPLNTLEIMQVSFMLGMANCWLVMEVVYFIVIVIISNVVC